MTSKVIHAKERDSDDDYSRARDKFRNDECLGFQSLRAIQNHTDESKRKQNEARSNSFLTQDSGDNAAVALYHKDIQNSVIHYYY